MAMSTPFTAGLDHSYSGGMTSSQSGLAARLALGSVRQIEGKEFVFIEGDPTTNIYYVESGAVSLFKVLPDGRRQILGFAYPGDFLGLGAEGERLVSAQALKATRVRSIPVSTLHKIASRDPDLSFRLYQALAAELDRTRDLMLTTGHRSAGERVASFLLALSRRNRRVGKPRDVIDLPMTRTDIADFLGLTIETVSRTLTKFKTRKLIDLPQSARVQILNIEELERMAEGEEH
jgi:CRP/FNR family transcriptional regulator